MGLDRCRDAGEVWTLLEFRRFVYPLTRLFPQHRQQTPPAPNLPTNHNEVSDMATLMVLSASAIVPIVRPQGRSTPHNDSNFLLALDVTVEQASSCMRALGPLGQLSVNNAIRLAFEPLASSILSTTTEVESGNRK